MKKAAGSERRRNLRVNQSLPIKLAVNGYDFSTSTQNLSCLGAYCRIDKYMPPFTKVMVKLSLPIGNTAKDKNFNLACRGVVVRTEDDADTGGFNIAIFFNEIKENQRKRLSQYISRLLPKETLVPERN